MKVISIDESTGKRVFSRTEVAKICGVSAQSIRLWEDAGKIPASTRDENDYRYWLEEDIENIKKYANIPRKEKMKKLKN